MRARGASEVVVTAEVPLATFRLSSSYAFDLGDGYPLPDPRSLFQPWEVCGPSRTAAARPLRTLNSSRER